MDPKELKAQLLAAAAMLAAAAVGNAASVQTRDANGNAVTLPVSPDTDGKDPGLQAKMLVLAHKTTDFYVWLLAAEADTSVFTDPAVAATGISVSAPGVAVSVLNRLAQSAPSGSPIVAAVAALLQLLQASTSQTTAPTGPPAAVTVPPLSSTIPTAPAPSSPAAKS